MNCKQLGRLLDRQFEHASHPLPLPSAALEHVTGCERCRELYEFVQRSDLSSSPSGTLRQRIAASLRHSLEPVVPLPSDRKLIIRFAAVFSLLSLAVAGMMGGRAIHALDWWQIAGVLAIVSTTGFLLCRSLSRQMVPGSSQRMSLKWLLLLVPVALALTATLLFPWSSTNISVRRGLPCLDRGLLIAVPAGVLFWLLVRRGAVLSLSLAIATTGSLAGLVAVAVMQFNCLVLDSAHIAVWHTGFPVILSVFGFVLGKVVSARSRWQP